MIEVRDTDDRTTEEKATSDNLIAKLVEALKDDHLRIEFGMTYSFNQGRSFVCADLFTKVNGRWKKVPGLPMILPPDKTPFEEGRSAILHMLANLAGGVPWTPPTTP